MIFHSWTILDLDIDLGIACSFILRLCVFFDKISDYSKGMDIDGNGMDDTSTPASFSNFDEESSLPDNDDEVCLWNVESRQESLLHSSAVRLLSFSPIDTPMSLCDVDDVLVSSLTFLFFFS